MEDLVETKLDRIDDTLEQQSLNELWLLRPHNFAWVTGGDAVVDASSDVGVAAVGFDGNRVRVLTANNEADRIVAEELPALDAAAVEVAVEQYEWYESSLREAVATRSRGAAGADLPIDGLDVIDPTPLRTPMPSGEKTRYRTACKETAIAVESVCADLTPDTTEREATASLVQALMERGFAVPVVLVGGSRRAVRHRHYTPTDEALDQYGHLTVVAERGGHDVAVTRTVTFDPPDWLRERHDAACTVAATAAAATRDVGRSGGTAGDVFDAIEDAYAAVGYPDEWRAHHQGGAIGYETREWTATPSSQTLVVLPMPFAWNPTVQGAKC